MLLEASRKWSPSVWAQNSVLVLGLISTLHGGRGGGERPGIPFWLNKEKSVFVSSSRKQSSEFKDLHKARNYY